jgi:hypothetical protein
MKRGVVLITVRYSPGKCWSVVEEGGVERLAERVHGREDEGGKEKRSIGAAVA